MIPRRNPNITSEEKYKKFPVNWLPDEFKIIEKIAREEYMGVKAQYIRRTIKHDLQRRGLIGKDNGQIELFPEYIPVQMEKRKIGVIWKNRPSTEEYLDPPHKFMGFIGGLRRNSFKYRWFVETSEKGGKK